ALLAKVPAAALTAQQCWYAIARCGGYLRRRSSGPPGWKTLWKGWFYVQTLLEGVHLATRLSLDEKLVISSQAVALAAAFAVAPGSSRRPGFSTALQSLLHVLFRHTHNLHDFLPTCRATHNA